jgi:general L-amino acid transport system permease protein
MGLIILPQALKLVIPGIVNTFIALFKDTTLVLIIGLFDLLGMIQSALTDPNWLGYAVRAGVCRFGLLDLLLRHVALQHVAGEKARHRASHAELRSANDERCRPKLDEIRLDR